MTPEPIQQLESHRADITAHCYRMLGSIVDADDAVQETMVRAWRGIERFDARASLRTWLHRIATNVCLDALAERKRRARPMEEGPAGTLESALVSHDRTHWLEPVPDARVVRADADPAEALIARQNVRLAFVAALQHLPPRQRAALLLTELLGWSAGEVAETLDMSVPAVNSALQRARATLESRDVRTPGPVTPAQTALLERYVSAFHRFDVDALAALMREDATFSMPPYALWFRGRDPVRAWLRGPGAKCNGSRLIPVQASGSPAFAQYRADPAGGHTAWALVVLELEGDAITGWNSFLDTAVLFPRFDLPLTLSA